VNGGFAFVLTGVPAGPISGFFKGVNMLQPLSSSENMIIVTIIMGINFIKVYYPSLIIVFTRVILFMPPGL